MADRPRLNMALGGAAVLAAVAVVVFCGVAVHEVSYASDHPYRYGPAMVIAWGAGAGALVSLASILLCWALIRGQR